MNHGDAAGRARGSAGRPDGAMESSERHLEKTVEDVGPGEAAATLLTFLIADVRGYTSFTRERGDAAAAMLAKKFADLAREAVEARTGRVLELRGDEALAVFHSSAQAVRAAVEFQATCAEESSWEPAFQLPVGVGIDAGEASPVEGGYRGVSLNTAARLCSSAAAGQVLVSRTVVDLSGAISDVVFAERGMATFKGFEEPVEVIEALPVVRTALGLAAAGEVPLREEPGPRSQGLPPELDPLTPLVDRDREMLWLRGTWRQARRGRGRILLVSGPAQIGKTRLAAEMAAHVYGRGEAVRYAGPGGAGTALALAAVRDSATAQSPTLVVLDDIDVAGPPVAEALTDACERLATEPVLVLGLLRDPESSPELSSLIDRLDERGDAHRRLGPLDLEGVRGIVRLYAGEDVDHAPVESMARSSGGVPGRVHEVAADWARSEATRRLAAAAEWLAWGRDRRSADLEFANNVIGLKLGRLYSVEGRDVLPDESMAGCPYKGLSPFDEADAPYFFGRERLVGELAARTVQSGLLGVVGPSGSGKSSLVAAGLLPSLAAGLLPGSERWRQVVMRPGEHPSVELRRSLEAVMTDLPHTGDPLVTVIERASEEERLVLAVDQFEEAFTTCTDEDEREAFISALTEAAGRHDRAIVVLGIRADFYGHCAAYANLAGPLAANQVLVGPMTRDELRRAIELPARRAGLRMDSALIDALVEEVADEPGGLPLLSTALVELWGTREGGWIRMESYERTAGVRGAVARLAEATFEHLTDAQQEAARRVLLRLVASGEADVPVRRRVQVEEFDLARDAAAATVISRLTADRLLTRADGTVEVAHEALLREWPRLRTWLEEDAQGRQLRQHLTQVSRQWQEGGQEPSELYRGARLSAALDWSVGHGVDLNELEREFLGASRQAGEWEADRQRRTNRRLRVLLAGVAVFLIVSLVAGGLALVLRAHAQKEATRARTEALVADARRLDTQALAEGRLDRSLLLALAAARLDDSVDSQSALLTLLIRSQGAIGTFRGDADFLSRIAISPSARTLAVGDQRGRVILFDAVTREQIGKPMAGPDGLVVGIAFSPDGKRLAFVIQGNEVDGFFGLADVGTGALTVAHELKTDAPSAVAFSPDGKMVATSQINIATPNQVASAVLWDAATGKQLRRLPLRDGEAAAVAFLPDGRTLVTSAAPGTSLSGEGNTVVWDLRSMKAIRKFPVGGVRSAFSPDGTSMAIGTFAGSVFLTDLRTGERRDLSGRHGDSVTAMGFGPDGRTLASVGADRSIIVWDIASGVPRQILHGPSGVISDLAFSFDGQTTYTVSDDGTIIIWNLSGERGLVRTFAGVTKEEPSGQLPAFALNPKGTVLAVPREDGTVVLWDLTKLSRTGELPGSVAVPSPGIGVAFSPDGRTLAVASEETVVLWDVVTRSMIDIGFRVDVSAMQLAFSPDGSTLAGVGIDGSFSIWDAKTHRLLLHGQPNFHVVGIAFSPNGRLLSVNGVDDGAIPGQEGEAVWDVAQREKLVSLQVGGGAFASAFSPDGRILATGDVDGTVVLWDAETWKPLGPSLAGQAGGIEPISVVSVDFSPDGSRLATSDASGAVRLWDVVSHKLIGTALPAPQLDATTTLVHFTRDGKYVLGVLGADSWFLWDVDPHSWKTRVCSVAGRNLTQDEWKEFLPDRPYQAICSA